MKSAAELALGVPVDEADAIAFDGEPAWFARRRRTRGRK
jgi:hypothetical protein